MFCLIHAILRSGVSALLLFLCALPAWAATVSGMAQPSDANSHPLTAGPLSPGHFSAEPLPSGAGVTPSASARPVGLSDMPPVNVPRPMDGAAMHRVGQEKNLCALTFDDGPGPHTGRLLDILAARGIRATFFVLGDRAARHTGLIQRMVDEGHEVANHTYSHKSLRQLPEQVQAAEIGRVQETLLALGVVSRYLRPPFGRYDAVTLRLAAAMGLEVVLWSVDSNDWQRRVNMDSMQSVYGSPAHNGIILFHDTHQPTVNAMDVILDGLTSWQCRFVTVSEFMGEARAPVVPDTPVIPERPDVPASPALPVPPVRYVQDSDTVTANETRTGKAITSPSPVHPVAAKEASMKASAMKDTSMKEAASEPVDAVQSGKPSARRPHWLPSVLGTFRSWALGVLSDSSSLSTQ